MSVQDVIKKSILESAIYQQEISVSTLITIGADLILALVFGLLIYVVYKKFFDGVIYSRNYAITLVGMTVLTCMVTLAISTNIVISLGMVGALSIVRYRTAVKEPLDLMYMFWAITTGITIGASMYILAVMAFVIMIILIYIFASKKMGEQPYILILHLDENKAEDEITRLLGKMDCQVRSKTMRKKETELTLQIRCKKNQLAIIDNIRTIEHVSDVTLLEYNGEYHG